MTSVVGLDGKAIAAIPEAETPLAVLKRVVAEIESGKIDPEMVFVVARVPSSNGYCKQPTWDSGLRVNEVICLLEEVKFDLLEAMRR